MRVATARAGNVIGGGDWTEKRLIPDCMKKWLNNRIVMLRNPHATRPWQHVLEALNGYLILAKKLSQDEKINGQSFNFSSNKIKNETVLNFIKKSNTFGRASNGKLTNKINFMNPHCYN